MFSAFLLTDFLKTTITVVENFRTFVFLRSIQDEDREKEQGHNKKPHKLYEKPDIAFSRTNHLTGNPWVNRDVGG